MKYRNRLPLVAPLWRAIPTLLIITAIVFSSCTALNEAQQRREKRILEQRNASTLMLERTNTKIAISEDALSGKSDHYTLKFAEDLHGHPDFDESAERKEFILTALRYMESLYEAMHKLFGFHPEHQIHVTVHDAYRGNRLVAFTSTQYGRGMQNGRYVKRIDGIQMDFPMQMYEKRGVRVHELTHAFTNIYYIPVWFSEGIAVLLQTEYAKDGLHPKFDSLKGRYPYRSQWC